MKPPQRYPALQGIGDTPVPGLRGRKAGLVLSSRAGHVLESLSCRNIVGRTRTLELASPGLGSEILLKRTRFGDATVVHPSWRLYPSCNKNNFEFLLTEPPQKERGASTSEPPSAPSRQSLGPRPSWFLDRVSCRLCRSVSSLSPAARQ